MPFYVLNRFTRILLIVFSVALIGRDVQANNLLLVDVHRLPKDCKTPTECIARSSPLMTNILSLSQDETTVLSRVLNTSAVVRALPRSATSGLCQQKTPEDLHKLPTAEKLDALTNHPGVYFDGTRLDGTDVTASFADQVRKLLKTLGLRLLTKEELDETPGRPTLSVSYSARKESEGCIIPFSVAFSIKEEVILVRDMTIKTTATVWSASARENLANLNYTQQSALGDLLKKFEKDYKTANP